MQGSMAKSLGHLRQAAEIQKRSNDESQLFFVHFNLGGYYLTKKQYDLALEYYEKALPYRQRAVVRVRSSIFKSIAAAYGYKNDYKNAYSYQEKYRNLMTVFLISTRI
jgi:tetratricopeptide (TPR) repeat protein